MHPNHEFLPPETHADNFDDVWAELQADRCHATDHLARLPLSEWGPVLADAIIQRDRQLETEYEMLADLMIDGTPLHESE